MPIYEFRCLECKRCFEKLILGANKKISCPLCQSEDVERIMSRFGYKMGKSTRGPDYQAASGPSCASCVSHNCSQCH